MTEVEMSDSHGQVTRLELSGTALDSGGRRVVLLSASEMLPHHEAPAQQLLPGRAQLALDSLGEGLMTTDAQGRVDYMNRAAETLTGIRREEALGQLFSALRGFRRRARSPPAAGSRPAVPGFRKPRHARPARADDRARDRQ